ncbi:MAG: glucose-6-phosphate dehydrogenase assembly protein OpcA [Candidatus Sumerlaeia bacterium]|nr:glucose-6-phosphate dehydrogenase assembly protein OpcA [Candidatus Sumerlaeia bacterium]
MATESGARERNFLRGIPVTVAAEGIERELSAMWKAADTSEGAEGAAVTRVCLSNLVWFGPAVAAERARRILFAVAQRQPSRIVLVEVDGEDPADELVEAFVNAHCFVSGADRHQVCSELIHLRVGAATVKHLSGLVAPLLLPDLMTLLWTHPAVAYYRRGLEQLLPLVDRFVTEASKAPDPAETLAEVLAMQRNAATLAWFRMGFVREQIAALFDDAELAAQLPRIESLTVQHRGMKGNPEAALRCSLLAGWIASRLGWTPERDLGDGGYLYRAGGRGIEARIVAAGHSRDAALESVEFRCGGGVRFSVELPSSSKRIERHISGLAHAMSPSVVALSEFAEADALEAAMAARFGRRLFEEAARAALPWFRSMVRPGP